MLRFTAGVVPFKLLASIRYGRPRGSRSRKHGGILCRETAIRTTEVLRKLMCSEESHPTKPKHIKKLQKKPTGIHQLISQTFHTAFRKMM
jgi:hypothetical protein